MTRCFLRTVKNVLYYVFGENECVGKRILKLLAKLFDEDAMRPRFAGGSHSRASVNSLREFDRLRNARREGGGTVTVSGSTRARGRRVTASLGARIREPR